MPYNISCEYANAVSRITKLSLRTYEISLATILHFKSDNFTSNVISVNFTSKMIITKPVSYSQKCVNLINMSVIVLNNYAAVMLYCAWLYLAECITNYHGLTTIYSHNFTLMHAWFQWDRAALSESVKPLNENLHRSTVCFVLIYSYVLSNVCPFFCWRTFHQH